ncbi:MAG TPA: S8 family serine peptidase [Candidatus Eisenbacteria bacterium]|jgi:hypothetical protein
MDPRPLARTATPCPAGPKARVALPLALIALLLAAPGRASAPPGGRIGPPALVAPAEGARLVESAVRFAFEAPRGGTNPVLVLSRRAFDPSGWTSIPDDPGLIVREAAHPVLSLADAGVGVDSDTRLWWAVGARDPSSGALRMSAARSFTALRKFANRIAPSPLLPPARLGALGAADGTGAGAARAGAPAEARGPPRIRLAAGYDFAPSAGEPAVPAELSSARAPREEGGAPLRAYLVQFGAPPGEAELAAIAAAGGATIAYIPDQAYLVRMSEAARAKLAAGGRAAWIGDYQPAYKLSPALDRAAAGDVDCVALLFADADLRRARADLGARGAALDDDSDNGINKLVRFRAPRASLAALAALPAVEWIEPRPRMQCLNDLAQWVVQTNIINNRRVWDMGIRGQGQVVMTSDSGILTTHYQFVDSLQGIISDFGDYPTQRKIIAYKRGSTSSLVAFGDAATSSWHGTHTAGTLCGSDDPYVSAGSARDGMAKEAKIYFMDIGGPSLGLNLDIFPDLNDLFLPPYTGNAGGAARLSSNSWGGTPFQAYTLYSMQADQFMWNHPDFYIAFANGNSGAAGTVVTPATAKSTAGIGATQNGTSAGFIAGFTSRGPTADGRRKPTFCSPGQSVTSSVGPSIDTYQSLNGTSMATPSGTGAVVLMRQYLVDGWYPTGAPVPANGFAPSAALLKAMAVNSADNGVSGYTAPDNNIGWGRVDADNVLYFAGDARKLLLVDNTAGLANGQYIEYQINVVDGAVPLEVTLCWSDYPGHPAAAVQLVNNLDLTVSKGATVYKGNVYSGGVSVTGGSYDAANVEESALVSAPATGLWTVRVAAPSAPVGPQPFALVLTGGVGNGAGALALDRAEYGSASTVELEVVDANAGASVDVSVTSGTEATPETVTLPGANGVYHGTLALSPLPSSTDDGTLTVSNGDVLTATYTDASPAATLTATARVDFDTPLISGVGTTPSGAGRTLVTWTTDRNASSRVYYGLTPALELGNADSSGAVLGHQVLLEGLTPGASYYYDVQSVSLEGSEARDSLGGVHHRFTAEGPGDVLVLLGDLGGFMRPSTWTSALQAKGYACDVWSGPLATRAQLGDLASGLRSYRAVIWQAGMFDYPPFSDAQRDTISAYLGGGGRLATIGHDMGWGLADPSSPSYTPARAAWLQSTLHAQFLSDPPTWTQEVGIAADPISGAYTSGVPYAPVTSGLSGDEVAIAGSGGSGSYVWRDNDSSPDNDALRWEDSAPSGSPSTALWGGTPSRLVDMFFEFTALDPPYTGSSTIRNDVLDKTLVWLFGRPRPTAAVTFPNGGESLTGASASITWAESVGPGRSVAQRILEYSTDGGNSWTLLSAAAGPSPYSWDLTSVPNTADARVRVRIVDDGAPALRARDASDAAFSILRTGGDGAGPVVVAGSIECAPNPIVRGNPATLAARVSDQLTGSGTVAAAEWSYGETPGTTALGGAMSGAFGAVTVDVSAAISTNGFYTGTRKLWVRAQDAAGNWGPWSALSLLVNGTDPVGVEETAAISFLAQNAPNPFAARTTIRFGLARAGDAALDIFDTQGRRVRRLVRGALPAGPHVATWDGADDSGSAVAPGVYCCRLVAAGMRLERRLVRMR